MLECRMLDTGGIERHHPFCRGVHLEPLADKVS